jgi:ATP-dependent helicase Lhr and Lhr-like helicase
MADMPLDRFLPFVRRWFGDSVGEPTPPQRDGWASIASGRNTLIVAPTGSGKTLAAFLWALDHLHRLGLAGRLEDRVYVVYVSPLRALNNDIEKNLRQPLAGIRAAAREDGHVLPEVRMAVRTGDTLPPARQAMTRRPPHILITTPESLAILLTAGRFRPALERTRFVIVDEVHALLTSKRGAHLALTLERLAALAGDAIQRIGCSATVRPVEEALRFLVGADRTGDVVDAGFARQLDLQVVTPVPDFLTAESDTTWDGMLQQIAEWIAAHRTTLVFTPSRRSAERLARHLGERLPEGAVAAHHGSLSRHARLLAEDRLKKGELRALVATSSLELGIDVGAIDLVVQVQSPRTIATGLQRIGRAGHLLTRTAKGRIIVTKGDELLEAAALSRAIGERQLDRQAMPAAPLDVLAQHVVACVATESWEVPALHALCRRAAPYAQLDLDDFVAVVRSLAEPLPAEVKGAAPRILWDRVNNRLHARRGTRLLALTASGTIPDAGLYDVFVADTDLKVGTLDEEFVTESLPGDVFLLGSRAWKIVKVRADRVLVDDAHGMSPTVPFWKGEHPSRSYDLGQLVGRLRRDIAARLSDSDFETWSARECALDPAAVAAIRAWIAKGQELLGGVPDDRTIVVESFGDEMGGRHAMIHSVFGMRVNGAWGMVLRETLRRRFGLQAEASHVDDGVLLSFAPGQVPPGPDRLPLLVAPGDVDGLLGTALIGSPLFTTRFRHAAVRALFIPRTYRGQRTPAWLQRLKADALMEAVGGQPEFPIVAETLRECFNDAFDVPALKALLSWLQEGAIVVRHVDTAMPSPFVYPLLLAWDWAYLDTGHAEERRSDAVVMRKAWPAAAGTLSADVVDDVVADLQKTTVERRARDPNELAALLDELGDLETSEIADRALGDAAVMIGVLRAEERVRLVRFINGREAWIPTLEAPMYTALVAAADPGAMERILLRAVRTRGPVSPADLAARYGVRPADIGSVLEVFAARGLLRKLAPDRYIHVAVLDEVQRRQAHARRVVRAIASPADFAAHVLRRQHVHPHHRLTGLPGLLDVLGSLQGEDFPIAFWNDELLPARLDGYDPRWLDQLGLTGDIVWLPFEGRRGRVGPALRENLSWLTPDPLGGTPLTSDEKAVLRHLELRGASFVRDIASTTRIEVAVVQAALWSLFWAGRVTPDTFDAILAGSVGGRRRRRRHSRLRRARRPTAMAPLRPLGRWSTLGTGDPLSAQMSPDDPVSAQRSTGDPLSAQTSPDARDQAWARILLARYGILSRELARGDWSAVRHALLRMEYAGEVTRGYFVEGLSGEQYATPDAIRDLERPAARTEPAVVVNLADPANLWGAILPLSRADGTRVTVPAVSRTWVVVMRGRPLLMAERRGRCLTPLAGCEPRALGPLVRALVEKLGRLDVTSWNGVPARDSEAATALMEIGFRPDGPRLRWERGAVLV